MAKGNQFPFTALPFNLRGTKPKIGAEGVELSIDSAVKQAFLEERSAAEGDPTGRARLHHAERGHEVKKCG
jgi:hypothetical protein